MTREMKDSGVEWIGRIPKTWEVKAGKYCLTLLKRIPSSDDQVVTCFRDGEVTLRSERREEGFTISEKEIGYQGVKTGDLVVHGMDGFAGAIGISKFDGKGSPILNVLDSYSNKQFLAYYLRAAAFKGYFLATATGIRVRSCDLRWPKLAKMPILLPPLAAQQAIADYLDSKCSQIDQLTDNIKQQIASLSEYKKALITQAVTKGLDPDVEMKDSGIEWIGEIPGEWQIIRIKHLVNMKGRIGWQGLKSDEFLDEGPYLITGTDFENGNINWTSCKHISEERFQQDPNIHIRENDLLITKDGTIGKLAVVSNCREKVSLNSGVMILRSIGKYEYDSKFLYYNLMSDAFHIWFGMSDTGQSTIKHLTQEKFENYSIGLPSITEQQSIASYLDSKCSQIDALIQTKSEILNVLQEYKKSLIFDYVTGKKEVPVSYRKDGCHE